jgi:hypothetical protein
VSSNLRNHDFTTRRLERRARRELAKNEIVTHMRVGPMTTAHGCMECGAAKKGKAFVEVVGD